MYKITWKLTEKVYYESIFFYLRYPNTPKFMLFQDTVCPDMTIKMFS